MPVTRLEHCHNLAPVRAAYHPPSHGQVHPHPVTLVGCSDVRGPTGPLSKGLIMARALYGHLGADAHLTLEIARLRGRVAALEAEIEQLRGERTDDELARELHELAATSAPALA